VLIILFTSPAITFGQNRSAKNNAGWNNNALELVKAITKSKHTDLEKPT
jgi:hypothetical protein